MTDCEIHSEKKTGLWTSPLVPVIAIILCLLPFINKPFNIDDPLFVWTAQQIQKHPFDFYGFSVNWYKTEMPMFEVTKNPPLASYYIAAVAALAGFNDIALHLAFIIPALAAALGTFYLARRYCSMPALAALITVLTPAFLVSGTTLMCDIMMLAFWVWSLFFWMRGIETKKHTDLFCAAILVSLAILTKYFAITLLALFVLYAVSKRAGLRQWAIYFLIPLATMALYQWLTAGLYGKGLLGDIVSYTTMANQYRFPLLYQFLVALAFTGGCIIPILFYGPFLWSFKTVYTAAILLLFSIVILCLAPPLGNITLQDETHTRWDIILTLSIMAIGGISLLVLAWDEFYSSKKTDMFLLLCWIGGTFIFAGFINWSINARSLLPMVPAVGILIARRLEEGISQRPLLARWHIAAILASALCALTVAAADYSLAVTTKTAADTIGRDYAFFKQNFRFEGHWGFQFYMQDSGYRTVDMNQFDLRAGDLIAVPLNNPNTILLNGDLIELKKTYQFPLSPSWLTTMKSEVGAGFYSHFSGPVPFLLTKNPPETYYIFELKPPQAK